MDKLKTKYKTEDEVPTEYAALYEEKDGAWILTGIEGANDADALSRVAKQRDKEKARAETAETKLKAFAKLGDKDPEELLALADENAELKAKIEAGGETGKAGAEATQKLIDAAVLRATGPLQRKLDAAAAESTNYKTQAEQLSGQMKRSKLESELQKAGNTAKLRPEAMADLLRYADVFEVGDDGKVVTRDNVGFPPGIEPDVWLSDRKSDRAHWWPDAVGGGSKGSAGGGPTGNNPFNPKAPNMTEAGKLMGSDASKAEQMARAAGFASAKAGIDSLAKAIAAPAKQQQG
jgi:hypothetical protein